MTQSTQIMAPASLPNIERLSLIADWQDDLRMKIARAEMIFQLHDCEFDFQPLADEVAAFKRVCACLAWR